MFAIDLVHWNISKVLCTINRTMSPAGGGEGVEEHILSHTNSSLNYMAMHPVGIHPEWIERNACEIRNFILDMDTRGKTYQTKGGLLYARDTLYFTL